MRDQIFAANGIRLDAVNLDHAQTPKPVGITGAHLASTQDQDRDSVPQLTSEQCRIIVDGSPGTTGWDEAVEALERCKASLLAAKRRKAGYHVAK